MTILTIFFLHCLNPGCQRSINQKQEVITELAHRIVSDFVNLTILECENDGNAGKQGGDGVLEYAKESMTFCLLKAKFDYSIHERDGQRLIRCWKFFLLRNRHGHYTN